MNDLMMATWLEQLRSRPDEEVLVSVHASRKAAQVRVSQMHHTEKWSKAPVTLRAGDAPPNDSGLRGAVYAKYYERVEMVRLDPTKLTEDQRLSLSYALLMDDLEPVSIPARAITTEGDPR